MQRRPALQDFDHSLIWLIIVIVMSVWQSWDDNLACKEKHLLSTENITAPQYHCAEN